MLEAINQYIDDVMSGRLLACKWVQLAAARHIRDMTEGGKRGLWFDEEAAQHAIDFFQFLKHSKGEWAGRTLTLEPWQQFVIALIFGWMRFDRDADQPVRRFRTAYLEVARKNGKSTMAAGVGLYLFDSDEEPGAEVYTAATKRDQARITHSEATRMVKASPGLRRRIRVLKDNLNILDTASKFEPLGRDTDSMDGLNVHGGIVDELHAHPNRETWDLLDTATGSRRQPLLFGITTAGTDRQTLCWNLHEYAEKILEQFVDDDTFFGIIFTLDDGDNWEDEALWIKANPNLGASKKVEDMQRKAKQAKEIPAALNSFLRRELNVWTQATTRWINAEKWTACAGAVDAEGLRGRICYGGLDLASVQDVAAFVLVFPPATPEDDYSILCRFWIPEGNLNERTTRDRERYETWIRQGFIMATPGNVIDHDFIIAEVGDLMDRYDVREIAFDRWGAARVQTKLAELSSSEDFLIQFGQGYASMSPAMKSLEEFIVNERIAHGNNPVLTWMAGNLVISEDPSGNMKPDKAKSTEKIDGMVALVMALDRAVRNEGDQSSVYDERGMIEL